MTQVGSLRVLASDGVTVIEIPVFDSSTSLGAGPYPLLKVEDPVDGTSIVVFSTSGSSDTIEQIKLQHSVYGVVCPLSSLVPPCPSYTLISSFASSPGDFTSGNFDNRYGSPQTNFVQVASPTPTCGESGQSLRHQTSTASTVFSNATYWTAAPGNNIELFAQFSGTSATFNIVIIYFGATAFGSTYRAMFDWGNSMCYLQNGGSTLQSAAISSRPTGQFVNLVVDYRNSSSDLKMDLLDDVNGTSLIGGPLVDGNTSHSGSQVGMYVKSSASDPIYVNALRTVP